MVILLKPVLSLTTKFSSHSNFEKSKFVVEKLNNYDKILVTTLELLYQETSYSLQQRKEWFLNCLIIFLRNNVNIKLSLMKI